MKTITRTITDPRILARYARETSRNYMDNDVVKFIKSMIPLHDAWLQASPPCPTCDGTGSLGIRHDGLPCPDCSDGTQPFDKWTAAIVALWTAATDARTGPYPIGNTIDVIQRLLGRIGDAP